MKNIAVFASGGGSNADKICEYFSTSKEISVSLCISNRQESNLKKISKSYNINYLFIEKDQQNNSDFLLKKLNENKINFIVLAGYLKKIPVDIVSVYKNKIINIHPSLLPKHGGKGMYGLNVHSAVLNAKDKTSGITIHYVNNDYDKGKVLFQASLAVELNDSAISLSQKIQELEHQHYASTIEKTILLKK
jgi:phosphoribosylglycinamide formyltransferase 1